MTKCMKCGVYIADNTDKCPLCQQVVAPVELSSDNHQGTEGGFEQHNDVPDKCVNDTDSAAKRADSTASHDNGTRYPDVKGASRKYRLLENIILFLSIVGQIVLTTVDYMTDNEINWTGTGSDNGRFSWSRSTSGAPAAPNRAPARKSAGTIPIRRSRMCRRTPLPSPCCPESPAPSFRMSRQWTPRRM